MQRNRHQYGTVYYSRSIGVLTATDFNKINEYLENQSGHNRFKTPDTESQS